MEVVGLGLVLVGRVHQRGLEGADVISGSCPRVGGILRDGDAPGGRGGETPHEGGRRLRWSQGLGQCPCSAELAGHCELVSSSYEPN